MQETAVKMVRTISTERYSRLDLSQNHLTADDNMTNVLKRQVTNVCWN